MKRLVFAVIVVMSIGFTTCKKGLEPETTHKEGFNVLRIDHLLGVDINDAKAALEDCKKTSSDAKYKIECANCRKTHKGNPSALKDCLEQACNHRNEDMKKCLDAQVQILGNKCKNRGGSDNDCTAEIVEKFILPEQLEIDAAFRKCKDMAH